VDVVDMNPSIYLPFDITSILQKKPPECKQKAPEVFLIAKILQIIQEELANSHS